MTVEQQYDEHAGERHQYRKEDGEHQNPDPWAVRPDSTLSDKLLKYIHDILF
jgi:hypothetical protein